MEIHSTGGIAGPDPVQPNRIPEAQNRPIPAQTPPADRAEISDHARYMAKIRDVPPLRLERIQALRELIASGKYETAQRIQGAVEKLLEELR